jgi:hypothetical protein
VDVGRVILERGADVNATPVSTSKDTGMKLYRNSELHPLIKFIAKRV